MKRGDFLKSLSALPFGIFAGNELVKHIEDISTKHDSTYPIKPVDLSNKIPSLNNDTIHRPDLIDDLLNLTRGKIGNVHLYKNNTHAAILISHQNKRLISLSDRTINKPTAIGKIKEHPIVMKTTKCKGVVPFKWSDRQVVKCIHDDIVNRIASKKQVDAEPDILILHDIMILPPMTDPSNFISKRGIMFRGAYAKF